MEPNIDVNSGPPASNLRRTSGRTNSTEHNMATVSDKMEHLEKGTKAEVMKSLKKTKNRESEKINREQRFGSEEQTPKTNPLSKWLNQTTQPGREIVDEYDDNQGITGRFTGRLENEEDEYDEDHQWDSRQQQTNTEEWGNDDGLQQERNQILGYPQDPEHEACNNNESITQEVTEQDTGPQKDAIPDISSMSQEEKDELIQEMYIAMRNMEKMLLKQEAKNTSLDAKLTEVKDNNKIVKKAVIANDKGVRKNTDKINQLEVRMLKNNMMITGIKEMKDENCVDKVTKFLTECMKISKKIVINAAYRIGKRENDRPIVIKLADAGDKAIIYKHVKNLKELKNEDGNNYYVNDQLPDKQSEDQRTKRHKIKYNKTLIDCQQQSIEWRRGELMVDGNQYKTKVTEPTNAEILEMDKGQIKHILKPRLFQGSDATKSGSRFVGYAMKVHKIEEVAMAYKQLKYRFMDATHIICAYRIMDPDVIHMQDCVDGGEWGAGRRMLEMMQENSFNNVATFVVRHQNGPNIGKIRFDMICDVAKSAVQAIPTDLQAMLGNSQNYTLFHQLPAPKQTNTAPQHRSRGALGAANTHFNRSLSKTPRQTQSEIGARYRTGSVAAKKLNFNAAFDQSRPQRLPLQHVQV